MADDYVINPDATYDDSPATRVNVQDEDTADNVVSGLLDMSLEDEVGGLFDIIADVGEAALAVTSGGASVPFTSAARGGASAFGGHKGGPLSGMLGTIGDASRAVVKSGVTKAVAGGIAFVLPPVGVPLSAGLVVADKAIRAMEGTRGTPKQQAAVKSAVAHTMTIAKKAMLKLPPMGTSVASMVARGKAVEKLPEVEREAVHTVHMLATAKRIREGHVKAKAKGKPAVFGRMVVNGKIERGHFQRI